MSIFSIVTSRFDLCVSDYNGVATSFSVANDESLNIADGNDHFTFYSTRVINTKTPFYNETQEKKPLNNTLV